MHLSFCNTYFDRKVKGRIYGNSIVINVCYREKWWIKPQPTANSWTLFSSVSNDKAVLSHLHHLKQSGKDNKIFSNPKIPTNIFMTFSIQNTFSCFSLNDDILPFLKGHFSWHSWAQEIDLFPCKTLQRLDYSFTSQHYFFVADWTTKPATVSSQLFLDRKSVV